MATLYKISIPDGSYEITKSYKGDIHTVAKKAWRDIKKISSPYPMKLTIVNMETDETYHFDYSTWNVAAKKYKRWWNQYNKYENYPEVERQKQRKKHIDINDL